MTSLNRLPIFVLVVICSLPFCWRSGESRPEPTPTCRLTGTPTTPDDPLQRAARDIAMQIMNLFDRVPDDEFGFSPDSLDSGSHVVSGRYKDLAEFPQDGPRYLLALNWRTTIYNEPIPTFDPRNKFFVQVTAPRRDGLIRLVELEFSFGDDSPLFHRRLTTALVRQGLSDPCAVTAIAFRVGDFAFADGPFTKGIDALGLNETSGIYESQERDHRGHSRAVTVNSETVERWAHTTKTVFESIKTHPFVVS